MALFGTLAENRIRKAMERGDFDGLPGLGKPIPDLDAPYDELWWIRKWIAREGLEPVQELRAEGGAKALAALVAELTGRRGRPGP